MHPLQRPAVVRSIERAASAHGGRRWTATGFTVLDGRASHPCGILRGDPFSVFAKLDPAGPAPFEAELAGLTLVGHHVLTPAPIGVIETAAGWALLLESIPEVPPPARTGAQWRSVGRSLARAHQVHDDRFGLAEFNGFFGPLPQDNRPADRWADFYAERRLVPNLRSAVDSGHLPPDLAHGVDRLIPRLPTLCGPEPRPSLLHGDAQQNNLLTTASDAVWVDVAPYFGHPELDLALLDYFAPVPAAVFDGYRDLTPIEPAFPDRRELWRLYAYLAVVTVVPLPGFLDRVARVIARYR